MEKPSYRPPPFFMGGLPGALKKEPGPSCEGPGMIRPVVPGLGPDDKIRRSMVRTSAHLALTRGASCLGSRLSVRRLEAVG